MEAAASLKLTVTHLFDAVRYSEQAREMEEAATKAEGDLESDLSRLESHTEEVLELLESMRKGSGEAVRELSDQLEDFLRTAKEQAKEKLEKATGEKVSGLRSSASGERDKALKSLEAYLASDPLPIIEKVVHVKLTDGIYDASSKCECEGGMRYEFRLAAQNSRLFRQELVLSRFGYELKVPVRFSRPLLKKSMTPGFERLDQYILESAEASGGKIRANFKKLDGDAELKVVTSGSDTDGFVGLEYKDRTMTVNIMNDPSLGAHVDLEAIRKAAGELATELVDLSRKKVSLLKLSLDGDEPLQSLDCRVILQHVLKLRGLEYKAQLKRISQGTSDVDLSPEFVQGRLKALGDLSGEVGAALGLQSTR